MGCHCCRWWEPCTRPKSGDGRKSCRRENDCLWSRLGRLACHMQRHWCPSGIKHGNGKYLSKMEVWNVLTRKPSIYSSMGNFPASHVWLPEGKFEAEDMIEWATCELASAIWSSENQDMQNLYLCALGVYTLHLLAWLAKVNSQCLIHRISGMTTPMDRSYPGSRNIIVQYARHVEPVREKPYSASEGKGCLYVSVFLRSNRVFLKKKPPSKFKAQNPQPGIPFQRFSGGCINLYRIPYRIL